jgi:hypothetical protein
MLFCGVGTLVKFSSDETSASLLFGVDGTSSVALVALFVNDEAVPWGWVVVPMLCRAETLVTFSCVDASVVSLL